ncbi:MAG TPA: hypothetical protein VFR41_04560, partial [Acidimicrobiia bacterium]|nr:hypothetical protein [Acidimicrobiia bacterium]
MTEFRDDELEASLRSVLHAQADSVSTTHRPFSDQGDVNVVALSDDTEPISLVRRRWTRSRSFIAAGGALAVAAAAALVVGTLGSQQPATRQDARNPVLAALDTTTKVGSFDVSYKINETPGNAPVTTTTVCTSVVMPSRVSGSAPILPVPAQECYGSDTLNAAGPHVTGTATV